MELFRALAVLAEPPTEDSFRVAESLQLGSLPSADEYTDLFVLQLYPFASVYLGPEGMLGGEARDRIAGFWRALGQTPPAEPDHLSLMLAMYARLCELEESETAPSASASWRNARKAFLWEHLLSWLPAFLNKLDSIAPTFYVQWSAMLMVALLTEATELGEPQKPSSHLSAAAPLFDPRQAEDKDFLKELLSPVRTGIILTRSDLGRSAQSLSLGLRAGERYFVLKSMVGQNPAEVFGWLAREAETQAGGYRRFVEALGETATFWVNRASTTASLLRELTMAASGVA